MKAKRLVQGIRRFASPKALVLLLVLDDGRMSESPSSYDVALAFASQAYANPAAGLHHRKILVNFASMDGQQDVVDRHLPDWRK